MRGRHQQSRPYLALFAVLLVLITIPPPRALQIRSVAIASLAPAWSTLSALKGSVVAVVGWVVPKKKSSEQKDYRLELENQQLKQEIYHLQEQLRQEKLLRTLSDIDRDPSTRASYYPLSQMLPVLQQATPARIAYRPVDSWNNTLWLNVGWIDNHDQEAQLIAKDSPVVIGTALVGVIDHVGKRYSRVRLLTDPGLVPSVRVARGTPQNLSLLAQVETMLDLLTERDELLGDDPDTRINLFAALETLRQEITEQQGEAFLAKGELHGSQGVLWRKRVSVLNGSGFNFDFEDHTGPARDLRSGRIVRDKESKPTALIAPGDLLITTGMDGIFPPGLHTATVTWVEALREGAYTYDIEARPNVNSLDTLSTVYVLPPYLEVPLR
jgi:rod shape-determining protein MreC